MFSIENTIRLRSSRSMNYVLWFGWSAPMAMAAPRGRSRQRPGTASTLPGHAYGNRIALASSIQCVLHGLTRTHVGRVQPLASDLAVQQLQLQQSSF